MKTKLIAALLATTMLTPVAACTRHAPTYQAPPAAAIDVQYAAVDYNTAVKIMNLDGFETSAEIVAGLRAKGVYPICYLNVGAAENWRPDHGQFPQEALGKDYGGWPGEKWLDIRHPEVRRIIAARMDRCKRSGFLGIDPDNLDGYEPDENGADKTGFTLTREDQVDFLKWLSSTAHEKGLAIGLKNAPDLAEELAHHFDWALTENCFAEKPSWCDKMRPFTTRGKPVFQIEYTDQDIDKAAMCADAREKGHVAMIKERDLNLYRDPCPAR